MQQTNKKIEEEQNSTKDKQTEKMMKRNKQTIEQTNNTSKKQTRKETNKLLYLRVQSQTAGNRH